MFKSHIYFAIYIYLINLFFVKRLILESLLFQLLGGDELSGGGEISSKNKITKDCRGELDINGRTCNNILYEVYKIFFNVVLFW